MLIIFLLTSPNLTSTASACFLSGMTFQTLEMPSPPVTKHWPLRFVWQINTGLPDDRRLAVAPEKQRYSTEFIHARIHTHTHTHMHIHTHMHTRVCTRAHTHTHMHTRTCACTHTQFTYLLHTTQSFLRS